jgi:hypothetical protein
MTDDSVKVYCYKNNHFVEVPEIYHAVDSNDITFIENERIFKIDIPENIMVGSKRTMDDSIYIHDDESAKRIKTLEEINKKHIADKFQYLSTMNKSQNESKTLKIENNKLKAELLDTRMKQEEILAQKNRALDLCNKLYKKIKRTTDNK